MPFPSPVTQSKFKILDNGGDRGVSATGKRKELLICVARAPTMCAPLQPASSKEEKSSVSIVINHWEAGGGESATGFFLSSGSPANTVPAPESGSSLAPLQAEVKVKSLSRVRLLATPWTTAYQAPLSMGFSRQEYWSGVPLPSPMDWNRGSKNKTGTCYLPLFQPCFHYCYATLLNPSIPLCKISR